MHVNPFKSLYYIDLFILKHMGSMVEQWRALVFYSSRFNLKLRHVLQFTLTSHIMPVGGLATQ